MGTGTPVEQRRKRLRQLLEFLEKNQEKEYTAKALSTFLALHWSLTEKKTREYLELLRVLGAISVERTAKGTLIKVTDFGKELSAKAEEEEKVAEPLSMPSFES